MTLQEIAPKRSLVILDPSDKFRPEKKEDTFRDFTVESLYFNRVKTVYQQMHVNQCHETVKEKMDKWCQFNHAEMTILEALDLLNQLVDEADPDCNVPNSVHAFQTAERIRSLHPDKDWFHLTGLVHDLGKIMACLGEPQWCVVGDTFPVGCQFAEECVFGRESFKDNPDFNHPLYSTKLGVYSENCGLKDVRMSWGHDEYMYHVLQNHQACSLPEEAMYMIRYHSFYPWHTGGTYDYLCDNKDREMMKWVLEFNKFDLYSKADDMPDMDSLKIYYQSLIDKYIPGLIKF